jgi:phospholipase B-like protein
MLSLISSFVLLAALASPATNEPINLAPNGSAESGGSDAAPAGWHVESGKAERDSEVAHGGSKSLRITAGGSWISDPVALEPGKSYELAGWVRTAAVEARGADAGATLSMESFPVSFHSSPLVGSVGWTRVSVPFVATAERDRIRCAVAGADAAGGAWFDEIELWPADPEPLAPAAVSRYGPGYRFDQAGWIWLHVEGEPYERGYQHGWLLSKEIAEFVGRSAATSSAESPKEAWKWLRLFADAVFARRYTEELRLEMKGIADGAAARGAKWDGRPVDYLDVVTLNAWTEVLCLEDALAVTPSGLEGRVFKEPFPTTEGRSRLDRCSAFAANGPATADGKIVFGHITMFGLYISRDFNVMIDLKPSSGHRVIMQGYPAAVQSGMDWYENDAGILITETTIDSGPFDIEGECEVSRIRNAAQYASSIDDVVRILEEKNNGLYANEWLIGDVNTNEIAMLELGTRKTKLWRSSKDEWPGGTKGFYWGCNNTKDADVRSEYVVDPVAGKPSSLVFRPADRDLKWLELFRAWSGKIDLRFGSLAFSTPPICSAHSVDAKVTTSEMAKRLMTWAYFGRPNGVTWEATDEEKRAHKDIGPIVSSGWTVLRPDPPGLPSAEACAAAAKTTASRDDAKDESDDEDDDAAKDDDEPKPDPAGFVPPWRGTVLPASDADLWIAVGSGRYYAAAEAEKKAEKKDDAKSLAALHESLGGARAQYRAAVGRGADRALASLRFAYDSDLWHQIAEGKGACVLHELRRAIGDDAFFAAMNDCGARFGGKPASTADLRKIAEASAKQDLGWFFDQWTSRDGAPRVRLDKVESQKSGDGWTVEATIAQDGPAYRMPIDVVLETETKKATKSIWIDGPSSVVRFTADAAPKSLALDPDGDHLLADSEGYSLTSYQDDFDHALIVYGTRADEAANRYAAGRLHDRHVRNWAQKDIPVVRDVDATDEMLKRSHVVLVGRPETNAVAARFASALPIAIPARSFEIDGKTWAASSVALLEAAANPLAPSKSLVLLAGLGPEATVNAAESAIAGVGYAVLDGKKKKASGWRRDPASIHRF